MIDLGFAPPTRRPRPRFQFLRLVRSGELTPRGYGFAWHRWASDHAVFLPIPLNVPARWARLGWLWFKRGGADLPGSVAEAWQGGHDAGMCRAALLHAMEDRHGPGR